MSVDETIEKNGRVLFRCHVEETLHERALEIPAWMFDSACRTMSSAEIPTVNCETLRNVKALLSASHHDPTVKEAQRLEGGTDAKETEPQIDSVLSRREMP